MEGGQHKRWQNLLYKKCPLCDGRLEEVKEWAIVYVCKTPACGFVISRRAYVDILTDENHIMRRFLTGRERQTLEEAIQKINK